ncbi:BQ2448_5401 [Microbotryum intermedium]|uniref:BQ2448_5401 protein n=1 Tax=Microbotryum intermedium TaxID=269621 RepID=A0A238F0W3_9BASI|nr:BQ2448_5401 [Microbotryum intermedium]
MTEASPSADVISTSAPSAQTDLSSHAAHHESSKSNKRPNHAQSHTYSHSHPHQHPQHGLTDHHGARLGLPNASRGPAAQSSNDTRTQLFVSNLPFKVRWQDLKDLCRKVGTVLRADVALSPTDGRSRGFGVVLFARNEDALKAIEVYHGYTWQTRVLDVRVDTVDPRGEIALAEANRQNALQQQASHYQMVQQQKQQQQQAAAQMGGYGWPYAGVPMPYVAPPPQPIMMPYNSYPNAQPQNGHPPSNASNAGLNSSIGLPALSSNASTTSAPSTIEAVGSSPDLRGGARTPRPSAASVPGSTNGHSDRSDARPDISSRSEGGSNRGGCTNGSTNGRDRPNPQFSGPIPFNGQHPPPPPPMSSMMMMMMMPVASHIPPPYGQRPPGPPPFNGRQLFIGNLPFNVQWQDLKDLMRGAGGSISRADIAQGPDGRSRGFGSVVFANAADAERAVQMFNGYEFNGRTLKVHFDKYVGPGPGGPGAPGGPGGPGGPPSMYDPPPVGWAQQPGPPSQVGGPMDRLRGHPQHQHPYQQQAPREMVAVTLQDRQPLALHELSEEVREAHRAEFEGAESSLHPLAASMNSSNSSTSEQEQEGGQGGSGLEIDRTASVGAARTQVPRPERITMPPPSYPFGPAGGPLSPGTPYSPMVGRLPPMTPSMPAFTFGAFPQTPPLHPASFFSPGVGSFSPQMGSPFFPPYGINAAPGAPVNHNDNPMFPPVDNNISTPGFEYPIGSTISNDAKTPEATSIDVYGDSNKTPPANGNMASGTPLGTEQSYFAAKVATADGRAPSAANLTSSLDASLAALRLSNAASRNSPPPQPDGWASGPSPPSPPTEIATEQADMTALLHPSNALRRKSFVPGASQVDQRGQEAFDIRRRFEGDGNAAGSGGMEGGGRRASSGEESQRRPKFGQSIWG